MRYSPRASAKPRRTAPLKPSLAPWRTISLSGYRSASRAATACVSSRLSSSTMMISYARPFIAAAMRSASDGRFAASFSAGTTMLICGFVGVTRCGSAGAAALRTVAASASVCAMPTHATPPPRRPILLAAAVAALLLVVGCTHHAPPKPIVVMTYNIHHGEGTDKQLDLPRLAEIIKRAEPTLVALQEVDNGTQR